MWRKWFLLISILSLFSGACTREDEMEKAELEIKGEIFTVEVARTQAEKERGLMFRKKLGPREGMIFIYKQYVRSGFWMKNTSIPLSIAFIADTGKILDIRNMIPFSEQGVVPDFSYMYALELNKGAFADIGAGEGDYIKLPADF